MYFDIDKIEDYLGFCISTILKEAREEYLLVKQVICVMLSAYSNTPVNLAINSPSGEGKSYVIHKVAEKFPKEDVVFLAGMTEKALFHRPGVPVLKDERGEYVSVADKVASVDAVIDDKESQLEGDTDSTIKKAIKHEIRELVKQKEGFFRQASKLIDLSHMILIFPDTPRAELLTALMPLLSHDKYEIEYEYVDTHNGLKTKNNVLRGWPAVIFAQSIDYSNHTRWPEIQRRFIVTNPRMSSEKYFQAIDLVGDRYGLPDFAYQEKIVSDNEKDRSREIIRYLGDRMLNHSSRLEPGKNNVIVPFSSLIAKLLPSEKAFDMTVAERTFLLTTLLATINQDKRPCLVLKREGDPVLHVLPFALFEDFKEALELMQYASGVRPYILEWFYEVFLEKYHSKKQEDSKVDSKGAQLIEKRIAVTTQQLMEATSRKQNKTLSSKRLLDQYINPLINEGYIDKADSDLDKRANIYFPVIELADNPDAKNKNLFRIDGRNNLFKSSRIIIGDPSLYPDKEYTTSKIRAILRYSEMTSFRVKKIKDHNANEMGLDCNEISIQSLVRRYYGNSDEYFQLVCNRSGYSHSTQHPGFDLATLLSYGSGLPQLTLLTKQTPPMLPFIPGSEATADRIQNEKDDSLLDGFVAEHFKNSQFLQISQSKLDRDRDCMHDGPRQSNKLFQIDDGNNFLFSCPYCAKYGSNNKLEYERHIVLKHPNKPGYPGTADLEKYGYP